MTRSRAVWIFLALLTAIRLALLGSSELTGDEAHYWMWSQRLAPSYFSKGPGIALVIRGGTALFGDSEFGVRFWSPILAAGTSILLFYFARRLFSETTAFWTVIALNVTPIFNIGSFVMTIDPLSIFFWVAAMFVFWLAVEKTPDFTLWWPLAGLCVGLGFLCKYTNALELVSIALVLALAPRLRREWKRPGIYALLSVFALCTLPPIIWNAQHDWITLAHLRARGSLDEAPGFHPLETLAYLGEHFVTYSPLLFGGLIIAVVANRRRFRQQFKVLFLVWFGLPVFLFYLLLSLNKAAAPNWDGLAFLSLGVLAVSYWRERIEGRASLKYGAAAALLLALGMSALALDSDLLRTFGVNVARRDPSDRMRGWKAAAATVETLRREVEAATGTRPFVIADERDRASEFSFYFRDKRAEGPGHPLVYIPESQDIVNQFSFWPRYDEFVPLSPGSSRPDGEVYTEENGVNPFLGRTALYVQANGKERVPHNIRVAFESATPLATIEVQRFGRVLRELRVFVCRNYRTLPL